MNSIRITVLSKNYNPLAINESNIDFGSDLLKIWEMDLSLICVLMNDFFLKKVCKKSLILGKTIVVVLDST